jgi:hypothetical protein
MTENGEIDLSVELSDSISVTESAFVSKANSAGETVGFAVSRGGTDPRVASSDLDEDGCIVSKIEGRASNKKKSELRTAQLLVQKLNSMGQEWKEPSLPPEGTPEEGVDAIASDIFGHTLKIQVTTPETHAWAALGAQPGPWTSGAEVAEAVQAVFEAVKRKHLKAHPDIHLVDRF